MRLHRFYITEKIPEKGTFAVPGNSLRDQLKKVFRLGVGDRIIAFDGDGSDHECSIESFDKDSVSLKSISSHPSRYMPEREVWLCASVIKKDTFEWIVEKATELGVSHIVPIMSERSEKKSLNMARLEKIAVEASEQSGRGDVSEIHPIMEPGDSIAFIKSKDANAKIVAFHTEGDRLHVKEITEKAGIAAFIGPEGGWSDMELGMFRTKNVPIACLGKQILRAETAAITALASIIFT